MNRFARLVQGWIGGAGPSPMGLEVGSWMTRVWWQGRVVWSQPSLAVFHEASARPVAVGERAAQMRGRLPASMRLWLPSDRGQWRFTPEMGWYLRSVMESVFPGKRSWWDWPMVVTGPVLATPSYLRGVQQTSQSAALQLKHHITQAEAAWAWYYKQQLLKEQGCVLVLGHGVSQVGYFQGMEPVRQQQILVGGQDLSSSIQAAVRQELQLEVGEQLVHDLKQHLLDVSRLMSDEQDNTKKVIKGKHILKRVPESAVVSQRLVQAAAQPPLNQLLQQLQQFVKSLSSESVANLLQQGLMVTGGGSQIKGLRQWLESELAVPVMISSQPREDVIQGVGVYASQS